MNLEGPEQNVHDPERSEDVSTVKEGSQKSSSERLLRAVEMHIKPFVNKIEVVGREHINEIPPDRKAVIIATHISDLDIPLAIKTLGHDFDLAISSQSMNLSMWENPMANFAIRAAGQDNFLPIDYVKAKNAENRTVKQAGQFNPDNFAEMAKVMDEGKTVIVAAHNPSENGKLSKGRVGGVYLAELADAVILPVAVRTKPEDAFVWFKNTFKNMKKRSDVEVIIGKPLELEHIEGIERFEEITARRKNGGKLSPEDLLEFKTLTKGLKERSDQLMRILAGMLPEENRGIYSDER